MLLSTELVATGGTSTGIRIPDDVVAALGGGHRPEVVATVGATTPETRTRRVAAAIAKLTAWRGRRTQGRAAPPMAA